MLEFSFFLLKALRKTGCAQWPCSEPWILQASERRDGQRELPGTLTDPFSWDNSKRQALLIP